MRSFLRWGQVCRNDGNLRVVVLFKSVVARVLNSVDALNFAAHGRIPPILDGVVRVSVQQFGNLNPFIPDCSMSHA